jgi:hypothetical protein
MPRRPLSAVRVPSVAAVWLGRLALAGAFRFARGTSGASILAGVLVPSVAVSATLRAVRSLSQQPNPAVNRTCAKSRAGRLLLRWGRILMPRQIFTFVCHRISGSFDQQRRSMMKILRGSSSGCSCHNSLVGHRSTKPHHPQSHPETLHFEETFPQPGVPGDLAHKAAQVA